MSGRYSMARGWMDHPLFEGEPYTRAQAWEWMISEAAWKETKRRIQGRIILLRRGQFTHSIRFMADKWKWSVGKVQRFLDMLKIDTMIDTQSDTGQLIVTIRNYDEYQLTPGGGDTGSDTQTDTPAIQERYKEEERKEVNNKVIENNHHLQSTSSASVPEVEVISIFDEVLVTTFGEQHKRPFPRGTDRIRAKAFLDAGASPAFCRQVFQSVMTDAANRPNSKPPSSLDYFRDIIPRELASATVVQGQAYAKDQPLSDTAEEVLKAQNYANMRERVVQATSRNDTNRKAFWQQQFSSEKRLWLEQYESINGRVSPNIDATGGAS